MMNYSDVWMAQMQRPDIRTNRRQVTLGGPEDGFFLHATEHYEIIDPNLPYEERFRTVKYTFDLNDEYDHVDISIDCSPAKLMEIGRMFTAAAADAYAQMMKPK